MKEEIIEKLIKSSNKEDLLLGLRYAWDKFKLDRYKFEDYLRNTRKYDGQYYDIYIDKEINVTIYPNMPISVYGGYMAPNGNAEVFYI